jgi:hypothetical protein
MDYLYIDKNAGFYIINVFRALFQLLIEGETSQSEFLGSLVGMFVLFRYRCWIL